MDVAVVAAIEVSGGGQGAWMARKAVRALVRAIARPAAELWLRATSATTLSLPLPTGPNVVHTVGSNPMRILLAGGGIADGFGVLSHELALPGQLARNLTAVTGRAVDMDIIAGPKLTAPLCRAALHDIQVARYDVVVLTMGLLEALALVPQRTWSRDLNGVLDYLQSRGGPEQRVFVVGLPPLKSLRVFPRFIAHIGGQHAVALNEVSQRVSEPREHVTYVPFEPGTAVASDRFRGPGTYAVWGEMLVPPIAAGLSAEPATSTGAARPAAEAADEADRQGSLDALQILDTPPEERFDRITRTARDLLGTSSAAITFIDRDRHWFKSRLGIEIDEMPRFRSLCDITIQGFEHFVVTDAANDDRFTESPVVVGAPFLRFYAGYPITAPDGVRVGTLSVFDAMPRSFSESEAALLRELAISVQSELRSTAASEPIQPTP